ncbi:MAG: bifunctional adenosylcobinamide kinase/adenosylcobinamide-phosphate guanylyltransferase, partial [Kamptonema sp. SIO4C4]|nr:bifunctional adenosylcobinamide kinase/adenosylcobinamide-phosphate guanylyltransferase [Kamptonema sp. SIO4C4]
MQQRPIILVTGPASSGKSEWAEKLATQQSLPVSYVATAQPVEDDAEWMAKIAKHAQRRPQEWETLR